MSVLWRWAASRVVGTSHVKSGLPCQDFGACKEFETPKGTALFAVVSDGAGSAIKAERGARLVCVSLLRSVERYFEAGGDVEDLDDNNIQDWIDDARERINYFAARTSVRPRDCAATVVAVLAGPRSAVIIHVGDGAAVVREKGSEDWIVPSWPFQGEYASTTAFVTDDPSPRLVITRVPTCLDRIAVFTDGIERLVLDHTQKTAYGPFFDRMMAPLLASVTQGRDASLSRSLAEYLGGPSVCERTDDDKSLILGVRL